MSLKRAVYGLPIMASYREWRTRHLAMLHRDHPLGFRFAGSETYFDLNWEAQERSIITAALDTASVFIDIGANQGIYTCLAASSGKEVVAVEPEPGNLRFLLSNLEANDFVAEVLPLALSSRPGVMRIYGDGDMASLEQGWTDASASFSRSIPVNTLDNLFAHRWSRQRLFIKMDVEGHEHAVLEGASVTLKRDPRPTWLIEVLSENPDGSPNLEFARVFGLMSATGYRCEQVASRSYLFSEA